MEKTLREKSETIVKVISTMPTDKIRHYLYLTKEGVRKDIAELVGCEDDVEAIIVAIKKLVKSKKTEEDEYDDEYEMKLVV